MSDFAREVEPSVGWRLVFLKANSFNHIWKMKEPTECEMFGAWLLAHISQTGNSTSFMPKKERVSVGKCFESQRKISFEPFSNQKKWEKKQY
jgi:hypothetical protein